MNTNTCTHTCKHTCTYIHTYVCYVCQVYPIYNYNTYIYNYIYLYICICYIPSARDISSLKHEARGCVVPKGGML